MVRAASFSGGRATVRCAVVVVALGVLVTVAPRASAADVTLTTIAVPTPGGEPIGITAGPAGTWYADAASAVIGQVHPNDSITEFALNEADAAPTAIAVGPDGAVWFTESGINAIGRLSPAGDVVDFPLPAVGSSPAGIAAGPDGKVWFTLRAANALGWADGVGGVTTLPLANLPGPFGITAGPDGAMWFTQQRANAVARIDVATKTITPYALPTTPTGGTSNPGAIVAGLDGALWFTMRATNQIGRLTTGGAFSAVNLPDPAANPGALAVAPDGAIWFTEIAVDKVGRITSEGVETFSVGDAPKGIAVEPDGDVWVTVDNDGVLTRISFTPPEPEDTADPTIAIDAPAWGDWTVRDSDGLVASYTCADETELTVCMGDVPDGDPAVDDTIGAATLSVHAEDAAGHTADASASYLVFDSVSGSVLDGVVGPSPWLTLSLGMGLAHDDADPLGSAFLARVDCSSGAPTSDWTGADVRSRVASDGSLEVRWRIDRAWSGCRSLALAFTRPGWVGPVALFGPVDFGTGSGPKRP